VRTPWRTRATDFDLLGHVNNASYWAPIEGELVGVDRPIVAAAIEFRGGVTPDDSVMIAVEGRPAIAEQLTVWWTVDDRVAASAIVRFGL
jgi:acyl-ACP thioesterase